MMGEDNCGGEP